MDMVHQAVAYIAPYKFLLGCAASFVAGFVLSTYIKVKITLRNDYE